MLSRELNRTLSLGRVHPTAPASPEPKDTNSPAVKLTLKLMLELTVPPRRAMSASGPIRRYPSKIDPDVPFPLPSPTRRWAMPEWFHERTQGDPGTAR